MKFYPRDFSPKDKPLVFVADVVEKANAKLEEWLKDAPVIYGHVTNMHDGAYTKWYRERDKHRLAEKGDTHKAKLVEIEEL